MTRRVIRFAVCPLLPTSSLLFKDDRVPYKDSTQSARWELCDLRFATAFTRHVAVPMAQFSDLPTEILLQILQHFVPTYYDDAQTLQLARVHTVWADILYKGFREKYEFLDEQFVKETWAYLTMPEVAFLALMGHPYAKNPASKRTSSEYSAVWIEDFKIQRQRLMNKKGSKGSGWQEAAHNKHKPLPKSGSWSHFLRWLFPSWS